MKGDSRAPSLAHARLQATQTWEYKLRKLRGPAAELAQIHMRPLENAAGLVDHARSALCPGSIGAGSASLQLQSIVAGLQVSPGSFQQGK